MFSTTPRRTVVALAVVAFTLLAACSSTTPGSDEATTPLEAVAAVEAVEADAIQPVQPAGQVQPSTPVGPATPAPSNGGQGSDPAPQDPAPNTPPPVIDSFVTPDNIDCHNGNFQMFTASWTTTDATEVVISIDGSGPYATYKPDSSTSLPFDCSNSHTFLLTARSADGQEATRSITLDPRNVQVPLDDAEADATTMEDPTGEDTPDAP